MTLTKYFSFSLYTFAVMSGCDATNVTRSDMHFSLKRLNCCVIVPAHDASSPC
jgi:hypothetical protein